MNNTMYENAICSGCGAPAQQVICQFCGSLTARLEDLESEKSALEKFHTLLAKQTPQTQSTFLVHGFFPEHLPVLIEAGVHCAALIDLEHPTRALTRSAVARLGSIIIKLKLFPSTPESRRAIAQFEGVLREETKSGRRALLAGIVFASAILLIVLLVCTGLSLVSGSLLRR